MSFPIYSLPCDTTCHVPSIHTTYCILIVPLITTAIDDCATDRFICSPWLPNHLSWWNHHYLRPCSATNDVSIIIKPLFPFDASPYVAPTPLPLSLLLWHHHHCLPYCSVTHQCLHSNLPPSLYHRSSKISIIHSASTVVSKGSTALFLTLSNTTPITSPPLLS